MDDTTHFKASEFKCPCCGDERMLDAFIDKLEEARTNSQIPFRINSGYRCGHKQESLTKSGYQTSKGISPHEKGLAADIHVRSDKARFKMLKTLMEAGLSRFGVGSNYIHVDMDTDRNPNRIWHYK